MNSCEQVITALSEYLDDEVARELRSELESHLSGCKRCNAVYDSVRKTVTIVTESGSMELPRDLSERLMQRIMIEVRSRTERTER